MLSVASALLLSSQNSKRSSCSIRPAQRPEADSYGVYAMTKAAVDSLIRTASLELGGLLCFTQF